MDSLTIVSDPTKGFRATSQDPVQQRGAANTNFYQISLSMAQLYRGFLLLLRLHRTLASHMASARRHAAVSNGETVPVNALEFSCQYNVERG